MLTRTECPSWLYPVTMGATTIWERWDSLLEDGSINPGEMTSFNHYALGAVADWLHRVVGGLAPAAPGYHRLEIAPRPVPGLDWASTRHDTPYGPAEVEWRRVDGSVTITATVPANSSASVRLPDGQQFDVTAGTHSWTVGVEPDPAPQRLTTSTSLAAIIDDQLAYRSVLDAFSRIDPAVARDFNRRMAWVENQPLFGAFSLISPAVVAEVEESLAALNASRGV
jgi:alpha-L-rhamnosidase